MDRDQFDKDVAAMAIGSGSDFSIHSPAYRYFLKINEKFGRDKVVGINGGSIPVQYLKKTYGHRALLVGDAAGIVKPLSRKCSPGINGIANAEKTATIKSW